MKALTTRCTRKGKAECSAAVKVAIIVSIALLNIVGVVLAVLLYKHSVHRAE
ncbi:MAG: hypothetical protein MJ186_06395 [Clostridia bacterium]|nr:hypothetical protein [Clostridia bacterium]